MNSCGACMSWIVVCMSSFCWLPVSVLTAWGPYSAVVSQKYCTNCWDLQGQRLAMAEKVTPPELKLFNSMTRRKEPFLPAVDGKSSIIRRSELMTRWVNYIWATSHWARATSQKGQCNKKNQMLDQWCSTKDWDVLMPGDPDRASRGGP